jgi:hypothetical protein
MIYLSGKITDPDPKVQKANLQRFFEVERGFLGRGKTCFNPARLEQVGKPYEYYLAYEILWIVKNHPILFMMKGWEESRGSRLEHAVAKQLCLTIMYE